MMRNKRLFSLMIGLILFIAVMGFSLGNRSNLSWPEKFINDTVSYVQQWFYKPAGYMAGLFEDIRMMRQLYEENEQLRTTVARYARDRSTYNFLQSENERLKDALGFTQEQMELYNYKYLIAQVISVSPDPYNKTIKINLGSKHGVRTNMAVTTVDGLVGLVSRVSPFSSTVTPITELNGQTKGIAATVTGKESESFGIIESFNSETGQLLMTKIEENDKLAVGDEVITSGLGNVFPRGVVIGSVVSRQVGDFGLTHTAHIEPAAKMDKLTEVFVVQVPGFEELDQ
ncbi:rod shape-determining protein MreC [Paenibacillus abyssi]|nr:rod shape-determining protein MreC [Paenibacillus abyssi]